MLLNEKKKKIHKKKQNKKQNKKEEKVFHISIIIKFI